MSQELFQVKEQTAHGALYDSSFEHDNCGIGAIVDIHGKASHQIVADSLSIVENLEARMQKERLVTALVF